MPMRSQLVAFLMISALWLQAGVRKETENLYLQRYKNKAIFLKVPVRGARQVIFVADSGSSLDRSNIASPLAFKVGDQVRITSLDFKDSEIRFRIAAIDLSRESEVVFQFSSPLREEFLQQRSFEAALNASFTEGLHYTEIDSAKEKFIKDQFDQLLQQFAATTDTSVEFVVKTLAEKNPEYQRMTQEVSTLRDQLEEARGGLARETRARGQAESELRQVRTELNQTRAALESTRQEGGRLDDQRRSLEQQVAQLQTRDREHERQINELVKNLDVKTASNADMGKRVEALGKSIEALKGEKNTLSRKLEEVTADLEKARKNGERLAAELKQVQNDNTKLKADIRVLTSNRNSLQARYLETRQRKEILERAQALENALRLEKRLEKREGNTFQVADLYLLSKKVGTFEVQVPRRAGLVYPVRFVLDSPDTVQFTDEERTLFKALGEKIKIETSWSMTSNRLKAVLLKQEPLQTVAPRGQAEWNWLLDGEIQETERVSLQAHLTTADGPKIPLEPQEFFVAPAGIVAQALQHFSPLSLLAGAVLGAALFGLFFGFRSRAQRQLAGAARPDHYVAPKKL